MPGYLAIVLHAHLPYVRHPEHPRHLEERWLFEAILECYLPLVGALDALERDGVDVALTCSLTPTLGDMLQDELLRGRFDRQLARLEALQRKEALRARTDDALAPIVAFYGEWLDRARGTWSRWKGDLVGALVHHVEGGRLDLLASSATHAFLPGLVHDREAIRAQVRVGLRAFERQTGLRPCGFWLPECGYDPSFDDLLAEEGVRFTILESHGVERANPRPPAGVHAPIASPHGVAFFGRDHESGVQVWSRDEGYPGDPAYREFYRDIGFDLAEHDLLGEIGPFGARVGTGLKYHRVTSPGIDLADKALYDPDRAKERARIHAGDFLDNRRKQAAWLSREGGGSFAPIIVAPYDAELFGHWWFEGPLFLEGLFRRAAEAKGNDDLALVTPRDYLARHPVMVRATPAASTWGADGHAAVWISSENAWIWRHVHHETRSAMRTLASASDEGAMHGALRQLLVETLLLQSSDWPFILKMRTAEGYAQARARAHAARARELRGMISARSIDEGRLADLASRDDFLASIDLVSALR